MRVLRIEGLKISFYSDACTGDGGAPLVCYSAGKFFVVGLGNLPNFVQIPRVTLWFLLSVAWGIGCGEFSF